MVSIPVGIIAAIRQYTLTDKVITIFATIGYAMPTFLIGIYILYFGGVLLYQWTGFGFPLFGFQSLGSDGSPLDIAYHLDPAGDGPRDHLDRGLLALPAGEHARRDAPGLRPDRAREGRRRHDAWSVGTRFATP